MKVTQNILVSDLRNLATSGSNSVDFRIEDSQLAYWVDQVRSDLIAKDIQKRKDITSVWLQTISCLGLIQVDMSECCSVETGCTILRTELQLPRTIETNADNAIVRVLSANGKLISRTTVLAAQYDEYSQYTSNKPKWFERNGYIYIINSDMLDKISVEALWEAPSDLTSFVSCDGSTCFTGDSPYPCSLRMASMITDIVLKTKIFPFLDLPQDNTNDASNDAESMNKQ